MGPFDLVTMSASHGDQAAIYQKHYLLIRFQTGNKINNLARGGPTSMTSIFLFLFSFFRASRKIPNRMTRLESYRMFQSYRIFYARDVCRWFTRSKCFRLVDLQKSLCCAKKKEKESIDWRTESAGTSASLNIDIATLCYIEREMEMHWCYTHSNLPPLSACVWLDTAPDRTLLVHLLSCSCCSQHTIQPPSLPSWHKTLFSPSLPQHGQLKRELHCTANVPRTCKG